MKLRQRRNQNKMVHMAIEPVKQLFNQSENRSQTIKQTNTQIILQHHTASLQGPSNKALQTNIQQLPQTQSIISQQLQQSIQQQQQKQPNSGNIEQKQLLIMQHLTTNYTHDYYQQVLKLLALQFTKSTVWFILVFCLLKIFWVYEDILSRKNLEEAYLKNMMIEKMTLVTTEYQHTFAFLDESEDLLQADRNDIVQNYTSQSLSNCSLYLKKYICSNSTSATSIRTLQTISTQFLMSIDNNYNLLSLQIASLMAHIAITNVFVINLNTLSVLQLNLTTILQNELQSTNLQQGNEYYTAQLLAQQANTLQSNHISIFVNFINSTSNKSNSTNTTSTSKKFASYLNVSDSYYKSYELYQIFVFDQKSVNQQLVNEPYKMTSDMYRAMFNIYCLNLLPSYMNVTFPSKLCVSIKQSIQSLKQQLVESSSRSSSSTQQQSTSSQEQPNILYIDSNFTKILITDTRFITSYQDTVPSVRVYELLSEFITTKVQVKYPQYTLHDAAIIECLQFDEDYYEEYNGQQKEDLEIFRCYCTSYMHMLVSKYIFVWGHLTADTFTYHNLLPIAFYNDTEYLQIELFYLSNLTYYSDIHKISNQGVQIIQLTIKIYLLILTVVLFMFQLSTNVIENIMIQSLFTIKRLAKVVLSLDDVKKAQNQFKKIIKEIEQLHILPYTPILGAIIGYLQKFLWIKKLYHNNKKFSQNKFKKYRLLFEGLNLFKYLNVNAQFSGSKKSILQRFYQSKQQFFSKKHSNMNKIKSQKPGSSQSHQMTELVIKDNYIRHPGVLMYIYRELAHLEKEKIAKFKNIQILTRRKSQKMRFSEMNILKNVDEHKVPESRFGFNASSKFNFKEDTRGKFEKDAENSSLHFEDMPQIPNMESKPKENRGVRFSNQLQLIQFKGFNNENKSKFKQNIGSSSSIGKKSSLKSIKSIKSIQSDKRKMQQSEKQQQQRSQESSVVMSSSKKTRRQVTIKHILRGDESVHEGLSSMKFDENSNVYDKQSIIDGTSMMYESIQGEISIDQFYYTHKQALQQSLQSYQRIMHYYQQMVDIQQSTLNHSLESSTISNQQMQQKANTIYAIQLKRVRILYEYLQLLIDEKVHEEEEVDFDELGVTVGYQRLEHYERVYEIDAQLVEEGRLYKKKVDILFGKSISYKKLQQIMDSDNTQVALQANLLYAQQLHKLKPFLDYEVINSIYTSLLLHDTSTQYKQHSLQLLIDTLMHSSPATFIQEVEELQSIKKYYNRKHKKFYFIADMTEAFDMFTPILTKIYQLMNQMDLMEVYNLAMNEVTADMKLVRQIVKPQTLQAFLSLFEQLTLQTFKSKQKEKGSSKNIHKKYVYEKDFNEILGTYFSYNMILDDIEMDETEFSSFIVIILGGDQVSGHLSMITDDADSSSNQRQLNQLLHSEINRKISQNYYHMINIGTYLNNFLTKQGKLKKHIKNSPDLLEIDLINKNLPEHFLQLQKFLE